MTGGLSGPGTRPRTAVHRGAGSRLGAAEPRQEGPADLRLVPPALAAWAAAAVALGSPGRPTAAVAVACAVLAALLLAAGRAGAASRHRGRALVAVSMTLLCAGAAAASAALHAADVYRGPVAALAADHARGTVEVTVTGDPRLSRPRVQGPRRAPGVVLVPVEIGRVAAGGTETGGLRTPALLMVQVDERAGKDVRAGKAVRAAWLRLLPSTRLRAEVRLAPPRGSGGGARDLAAVLRVPGRSPPHTVRPPSAAQRVAGRLRRGLREATDGLPADPRALLPGLVVGDTARIPEDLQQAFRTTDMVHLLAVSGGNLTVLLVLLIGPPGIASRAERRGLAPRLGLPLRTTALLGALLTLGFVVVCRPEPSVLRAAACGLITILAIGTGRRRSLIPALAAAVLLLVLWDPWLARDFGFLLSVLATGALLTVAPRWSAALRRRGMPGRPAEALAAATAAQAACAPVVAVLSAHVSLVAVPCNLLAEFAVAPATVLGFAALATAPFAIPLAELLAQLAAWPAAAIATIARTGAAVPGAVIGWPDTLSGALLLTVLAAAGAALLPRLLRHPWLSAACAVLLLLALLRPAPVTRTLTGWPPPGWRLVMCDVGQGDALVLAAGDGRAVLIDTGPDPAAVDDCLRTLGVTSIPLLLLSHFHADHVAGLPGALRGRAVGAVQTTGLEEPVDQARFVRRTARQAGVPLIRAGPGERRALGGLSWQVLWPSGAGPPPGGAEANNASVTLLVRTGGLTVFLPGDLEPPAQRRLLTSHPQLSAVDVLKVAHHGSSFQDPGLLARLSPRIALISCGAENNYGHPSPQVVSALRADGAAVLRTDTGGALAVTGSGDRTAAHAVGR